MYKPLKYGSFEGLTAICAGLDVARPAHVLDVAAGGVVFLEREASASLVNAGFASLAA
jgi:hypothetical protein